MENLENSKKPTSVIAIGWTSVILGILFVFILPLVFIGRLHSGILGERFPLAIDYALFSLEFVIAIMAAIQGFRFLRLKRLSRAILEFISWMVLGIMCIILINYIIITLREMLIDQLAVPIQFQISSLFLNSCMFGSMVVGISIAIKFLRSAKTRALFGEKDRNPHPEKDKDFQNTIMTKQEGIDKEINRIYGIMNEGKYDDALRELNSIEEKNPQNHVIKYNKVGFLIDIGFGLRNPHMIKKGIIWGERILRHLKSEDYKGYLCYNIANGYMGLFQLRYAKMSPEELIGNKNLQYSKCCYREAIKRERYLKSGTKKQLYTNFGNCLDSLGRVMEALYAYDEALKIAPEFPMALGNKAKAMQFFADISGAYKRDIYIKAFQLYKLVLDNEEELIKYGGVSAKKSFDSRKRQIEALFSDKKVLTKKIRHRKYRISSMTAFERFYVGFCSKHKLYLNFHIHEDDCEASIVDPIFISMISPISDNETFFNLAKYINQIKEDYLVARLLLVQSQYKRHDFNRISKRMTFANTLDYSTFNVYIGLLKCAFKQAYNILDKVSRFINEYYRLGHHGKIYFATIWEIKGKKRSQGIRPEILESKNISLYALYDIYLDFKSGYYKRIQDIRNALIHERLVIYETRIADFDDIEDKYNIGYKSMLSETIKLMQMVKPVIIYLVNFVHLEENKKRRDVDGPVGPSFVDTTQIL